MRLFILPMIFLMVGVIMMTLDPTPRATVRPTLRGDRSTASALGAWMFIVSVCLLVGQARSYVRQRRDRRRMSSEMKWAEDVRTPSDTRSTETDRDNEDG